MRFVLLFVSLFFISFNTVKADGLCPVDGYYYDYKNGVCVNTAASSAIYCLDGRLPSGGYCNTGQYDLPTNIGKCPAGTYTGVSVWGSVADCIGIPTNPNSFCSSGHLPNQFGQCSNGSPIYANKCPAGTYLISDSDYCVGIPVNPNTYCSDGKAPSVLSNGLTCWNGSTPTYANKCPAGTYPLGGYSSTVCVGTPTNPNSFCSNGVLPKTDGTCANGSTATYAGNCPSGSISKNGYCSPSLDLCPAGTYAYSDGCYGTPTNPANYCSNKQLPLANGSCANGSTPTYCGGSYELNNGNCVQSCSSGKVYYNGSCITNYCPTGTTPNLTTGACSGTPTNPQSYCSDGSLPKVDGTCTAGGTATNCGSGKVLYNGSCITSSCPAGTTANATTGNCSGTPTNPQSYCSDGSLPKVDGTCTAGGTATNCGSGLTWNGTSCVAPVVPTTITCPDGSTAPDLASCPVAPTPTPSNGGGLLPNKSRATDATTWSGALNVSQANRFGMKFGSGAGKAYHPGAGTGGIMFTQNPNSTTSCHNGGVNYSGMNMKDAQLNTVNTRSNQDGCNLSVLMRKV